MHKFFKRLTFDFWYLRKPPWDTGITPPELQAFLTTHPPGRALDLGCGTGTNAMTLAQAGWEVTGVDFAARAIAKARHKLAESGLNVRFLVEDVTRLRGVEGLFDLILDIGCYHGLPPAGRVTYRANLSRLLKPGGSFLLYAHLVEEGETSRAGIPETDLALIAGGLKLVERQDSFDRWGRRAVWERFQTMG